MHAGSSVPVHFSVAEVARRLGISLRSARALIAGGKLPVMRPTDRRVVVAEDDLAAFVASRRSAS